MRNRMKCGKHIFTKITVCAMVCSLVMGSICVPVFAKTEQDKQSEEEDSAQKPDKNKSESDAGGEKETGTGNDTGEGETPKNTEETDAGDGTREGEASEDTEGTNTDQGTDEEESKKDMDGTDTDKDTEEGETKEGEEKTGTEEETEEGESKKDTVDVNTGNDVQEPGEDGTDTGGEIEASKKNSEEESEDSVVETVSGNDIEKEEQGKEDEPQEIIDVVVPAAYTLALNPYRLPITTGEDEISTEQVISGTYGIVNKSSTDQIVTVSLTVEDSNEGELVFVDSAEEAENAGMDVYAIYLTAVPANEEQILIADEPVDENVTGESLRNVKMTGEQEQAVVLREGTNEIAFKLSKAVYDVETEESITEDLENSERDMPQDERKTESVLRELASDGRGVTAYTFSGVMNPNASWENLSGGIKLSVVYTYQTADGSEEILEGTGAMIAMDRISAGEQE